MSNPRPNSPSAVPVGALPDINAETYPAEEVQRALDRVARFHLYAAPPEGAERRRALLLDGERGFELALDLHPASTVLDLSTGLGAKTTVREVVATYRSRWLLAPPEVAWKPGVEPPPTGFEPSTVQGLVLLGDLLRFGESKRHGFSGYGIGRTYPGVHGRDDRVAVAAIGNLTQSFGKFRGLEGTYVLNGVLSRHEGFRGDLTVCVRDPEGLLRGPEELAEPPVVDLAPDAVYLPLVGRKASPRDRSEIAPSPEGRPDRVQLTTSAEMRTASFRVAQGPDGLFSGVEEGPAVATLDATVRLDIAAPPGTADAPNPFTTRNVYRFREPGGREVGSLEADLGLGRSFDLSFPDLPGQRGLRFGGAGEIVRATGVFEGCRGLVSVNSAIGIAPHVLSVNQVLRLVRPPGVTATRAGQGAAAGAGSPTPVQPAPATTARVMEQDVRLPVGARMHYRESGSEELPTVLMLHGNPGNSGAWSRVMSSLADVAHCIAPDLMGFGGSEKPRVPPTFYHHAEYLDQLVATLGLRDFTLFIQDWGGALGFDHAVRHRDNIRAIAFFEAILKPYESWETFPQQVDPAKLAQGDPQQTKSALARQKFQDFRKDETLGGSSWEQVTVGNVFLKIFMGPLLGHPFDPREIPEPESHPVLGPLLAPYLEPFPTIWSRNPIWRLSREIPIAGSPADVVATTRHYSRVLGEWDVPKLLIYSDKGPTLKEEHAQWVREHWGRNLTVRNLDAIPGVEVVEGTHFLQQTHPELITRLFRDWYTALSARRSTP